MNWKDILANGELIPIGCFPQQYLKDKNSRFLYFYADNKETLIMEQVNPRSFNSQKGTHVLRCPLPERPAC